MSTLSNTERMSSELQQREERHLLADFPRIMSEDEEPLNETTDGWQEPQERSSSAHVASGTNRCECSDPKDNANVMISRNLTKWKSADCSETSTVPRNAAALAESGGTQESVKTEDNKDDVNHVWQHCYYSSENTQHFSYGLSSHADEKPYVCLLCSKCFCSRSQLSRHCQACTFANSEQYDELAATELKSESEESSPRSSAGWTLMLKHICWIWFCATGRLSNFHCHLRTHRCERPYMSCTWSHLIRLRRMRSYRDLSSHALKKECEFCRYVTCSPYDLEVHKRIHAGQQCAHY